MHQNYMEEQYIKSNSQTVRKENDSSVTLAKNEDLVSEESVAEIEKHKAATRIQTRYRGNKARESVSRKKERIREENHAATTIQTRYRGIKGRRRVQEKRE